MAINLNHGVLMGKVIGIYPKDSNVRINLAVEDDYRDRNKQYVDRDYIISVSFLGDFLMEKAIKTAQKGEMLLIEYKLTSYKPQDSQYQVVSVTGTNIYALDTSNSAPAQNNDSNVDLDDDVPF